MLVETMLPRRDVISVSEHDPSKDVRTFKANSGIASVILLHLSSDNACHDVLCWKIIFVSKGQIPESSNPKIKFSS